MPTRPEPGLQQHDLRPAVAAALVDRVRLDRSGVVVEVGPGKGNLTAALLQNGAEVHAVEIDPGRCALLRDRFAAELADGRFHLVQGDALCTPIRPTGPWQVVANPPFQHTAALLDRWLFAEAGRIDLVIQREAAIKLGGRPGAETRSSILVRLAGRSKLSARLERHDVDPPSRVDLVHWTFERSGDTGGEDLALVDRLLQRAFAGTRTMREALRGLATGVQIKRQAQERGWDPESHPRTLVAEDWLVLARLLKMCGKI